VPCVRGRRNVSQDSPSNLGVTDPIDSSEYRAETTNSSCSCWAGEKRELMHLLNPLKFVSYQQSRPRTIVLDLQGLVLPRTTCILPTRATRCHNSLHCNNPAPSNSFSLSWARCFVRHLGHPLGHHNHVSCSYHQIGALKSAVLHVSPPCNTIYTSSNLSVSLESKSPPWRIHVWGSSKALGHTS
jgi:hypothetical protein